MKRGNDLVDKISTLPDSILGLILSLLPTKNAVATSVLSKRWKFMWMAVYNLDFCHEGCSEGHAEGEDIKFIRFVNRVLLSCDGLLKRFCLVWKPGCDSSHVTTWINTAVERKVHELFLSLQTPVGVETDDFPMPISFFNCNSLQYVELKGRIYVSTASVVCLPRLESLKLVSVNFESEEAFEKLVSRCLKLTYLHLHTDFIHEKDDFMYIISSTSLKRLEVCFEEYQCRLKLMAPLLQYLEITEYISRIFVQKSVSSLDEANLRIDMVDDDFSTHSIVEAVRAFDSAKALTLSSDVMWALGCAEFFLLTKFKRLVRFEATICCCICSTLRDLIEHSDCLEVLLINQGMACIHGNSGDHSEWTPSVQVPRCLSRCLKTVVIEGYHGFDDEREMIGYILQHGSVVELMKISCDMFLCDSKKLELVQGICKFTRKSPVCAVEFFR